MSPAHLAEGGPAPAGSPDRPAPIKAIPVRHYGQWVAAAVVIAAAAWLVSAFATTKNIQWHLVGHYLFRSEILSGLWMTLWLTAASMAIGVVGGILLAVMRLSSNRVLKVVSGAYLWFFRGTPVLVQIVMWFNLALVFPRIGFGSFSQDTNTLISATTAALLALALNEAAYMAEIVRGGILSVDAGQSEAAHALGLSSRLTMVRVVLPQAMRVIVPPTGNEVITMLKTTALVVVIGAKELWTQATNYGNRNFTPIELYIVASIWYLVMTSVLTVIQGRLEKKYAKGIGHVTAAQRGVLARMIGLRSPQGGVA